MGMVAESKNVLGPLFGPTMPRRVRSHSVVYTPVSSALKMSSQTLFGMSAARRSEGFVDEGYDQFVFVRGSEFGVVLWLHPILKAPTALTPTAPRSEVGLDRGSGVGLAGDFRGPRTVGGRLYLAYLRTKRSTRNQSRSFDECGPGGL